MGKIFTNNPGNYVQEHTSANKIWLHRIKMVSLVILQTSNSRAKYQNNALFAKIYNVSNEWSKILQYDFNTKTNLTKAN